MFRFKIGILLLISLFLIPNVVRAEVEEEIIDPFEGFEIVSQETKYYKVITYYDNASYEPGSILSGMDSAHSESFEITEEEYLNAPTDDSELYIVRGSTTIETTYKRMTCSIVKNGNNYRYINILNWKKMPAVRSNDIIGIGFLPSVEPASTPQFSISYTYSGGGSGSYALKVVNTFVRGVSCVFGLPISSNVNSINMQFWVDVKKVNTGATITYQSAYADYSHATTTTSLLVANTNHTVNQSLGNVLTNTIIGNYDSITEANATWNGTW